MAPTRRFSNLRQADGSAYDVVAAPRFLRFDIDHVPLAFVNAVRRCILAHVPCVAIPFDSNAEHGGGNVVFHANTSPLHNEMLGQRLGLVPVCVPENELEDFAVASTAANTRFVIDVKNTTREPLLVTTADIDVFRAGKRVDRSVRDALFPRCSVTGEPISLVKLHASETEDVTSVNVLHVEFTARLGTGAEHARWCPVSGCVFRNRIDRVAADEEFKSRRLPEALVRAQKERGDGVELTAEEIAKERAVFDARDAQRIFLRDERGDPNAFEFDLESECGLRPAYIVFKALERLQARIDDIRTEILTILTDEESDRVVVTFDRGGERGFHTLLVRGEGHTCGNLIQSMIHARYVRDAQSSPAVTFVGYHQPHPLEDSFLLCVKLSDASPAAMFRLMDESLAYVSSIAGDLAVEWIEVSRLSESGIDEVISYSRKRQQTTVMSKTK